MVKLMLILQYILDFQTQICNGFTNDFSQVDIPRGGGGSSMNFPGMSRVMEINVIFSQLRKNIYGKYEAAQIWNEKCVIDC